MELHFAAMIFFKKNSLELYSMIIIIQLILYFGKLVGKAVGNGDKMKCEYLNRCLLLQVFPLLIA